MEETQQETQAPPVQPSDPPDLEALITLIEARIIENLTQIIERIAQKNGADS